MLTADRCTITPTSPEYVDAAAWAWLEEGLVRAGMPAVDLDALRRALRGGLDHALASRDLARAIWMELRIEAEAVMVTLFGHAPGEDDPELCFELYVPR